MKPTFAIIIRFKQDAANFRGVEQGDVMKEKETRRERQSDRKREERFYKMAIISLRSTSGSLTGNNDGLKHRK